MSLDSRLRDEIRRVAAAAPTGVDPGARELVVRRTATVRRQRRVTLAVGVAAVVVVGIGLGVGLGAARTTQSVGPAGPSSPPPALSEAPAPTRSFTSPLYGDTVSYPAEWTVTTAKTAWVNGKNGASDPGVSDVFQSPGKAQVQIAVQQLPTGWTAAQWKADFLPHPIPTQQAACFPAPSEWAPVTIAAHPGGLLGRIAWCGFTEGVVVIGPRAYLINGVPDPDTLTADTFDMGVLNTMFATLKVPGAFSQSP
jgi:hypothetical protein